MLNIFKSELIIIKTLSIFISSLNNGGAQKVASTLSKYLSEKYKVQIALYYNDKIDYPYSGEIVDLNLRIKNTNEPFIKYILTRSYDLLLFIVKMKLFKKKYSPHTTISFLTVPNIINIFSRANDRVILSVHTNLSQRLFGFENRVHSFLIKIFYNKADVIVCVSNGVKKDLIDNFKIRPHKIKVIHNPYEIATIHNIAEEEIEEKYAHIFDYPVVVNVGRLENVKGQKHLLKAFAKVKKEIKGVKLLILGRGALISELETIATQYGLNDVVFFIGFQKNPYKFIKKSSVFVLSSLNEGFPNALIESMACGVPVISTDCKSGPREILAPDTDINYQTNTIEYAPYGILTPVCKDFDTTEKLLTEQETMLADSIIKMLTNNELNRKYGLLAKKRAKDFDVAEIIKQWEQIIEK